ncbi:hypothetical protein SDC9_46789 [bioreactor metagenome]|uniref:Cupin type-2 domain-containing protein n=1 Tax=bioreactor metagenome TaxID=1076179 RepID=A0A644W9Z2_9ZZZZ
MKIYNLDTLEEKFVWKDAAGLMTQYLGEAAGSRKLYVNIDKVSPGAFSTKYHSHSQQEEFFMVLSGCGTLRLNGKEYSIKKGNFIAKPSGQNIAHQFYNSGSEMLVILDVGTVEKEDTCYYPDEGVYLHKSNGDSKVFGKQSLIEGWTSDPNGRQPVKR